jgi:hypothetical protein
VRYRPITLAAVQPFLNGALKGLKLGVLLLVTADEVAKVLTVIRVIAACDSRLNLCV